MSGDDLTLWIKLDLLIRRLVGKRMEKGPDEQRDAFMTSLVEEQKRIGGAGWFN